MDEIDTKSNFSVRKAHTAQLRMSRHIIFKDLLPDRIKTVAGVDVAYTGRTSIGGVATLDYESLRPVESQTASLTTRFSYIPTLLSFRETAPAILCIRKLRVQPDLFLVDGHGLAHPYRCGFASHLGLVLKRPTIGVAKSRLLGKVKKATEKDRAYLIYNRKIIGAVLTTKDGCKPVYVSIGHMVSLETAIAVVKHCIKDNRLPEPILAAHNIARVEKRKINMPSNATADSSERVVKSKTNRDSEENSQQTPSNESH
jgi:deoxyribonuclease V